MNMKQDMRLRRVLRTLTGLVLCLALLSGAGLLPSASAAGIPNIILSGELSSGMDSSGEIRFESSVIAAWRGLEICAADYVGHDDNFLEIFLGLSNKGSDTMTVSFDCVVLNGRESHLYLDDATLSPGQSRSVKIGVNLDLLPLMGTTELDALSFKLSILDETGALLSSFETGEVLIEGVTAKPGELEVFRADIVDEPKLGFSVVGFRLMDGIPTLYLESRNESDKTLYIMDSGCAYNGVKASFYYTVPPHSSSLGSAMVMLPGFNADTPREIRLSFGMDVTAIGGMVEVEDFILRFDDSGRFTESEGSAAINKDSSSWQRFFASGEDPVKYAPIIKTQPSDVSAPAGSTISFSVEADGSMLSYKWQVKGPGEPWEDSGISTAGQRVLSFKLNESHDGLLYRCVVYNDYGSVTSDAASITVTEPPAADEGPGYTRSVVDGKDMYIVYMDQFDFSKMLSNYFTYTGQAELWGDGISYGYFKLDEPVKDLLMALIPISIIFRDGYDYSGEDWTGAFYVDDGSSAQWAGFGGYEAADSEELYIDFVSEKPLTLVAYTLVPSDNPFNGEYYDSTSNSSGIIFGFASQQAAEAFVARMRR